MLSRRHAWLIAGLATVTMAVSYMDRATLAVLAPSVTKALDISDDEYGWLAAAFSMSYLLATPIAGWWIDRVGARRGLVRSVLTWSGVAALHAIVPGFGVLFALRLALGAAEGPSFPGAAQTVHRVLAPADQARGFGLLFTGSSIGALIAPPLASWIYREEGWRVAFLGTAAAGLIWVPLWIALTRGDRARAALDREDRAVGAPAPSWRRLARHPLVVRGVIAVFSVAPLFGFAQAWGAKYLVGTFGVDQGDVGDYLWLPPLVFDAGALLFGDLGSRLRRAPHAPPRALLAIAATIGATIALLPLARTPWQGMGVCAVSLVGAGGAYTLITADLLGRMPPGVVSLAGGILAGGQSLSLIVSSPIIGWAVHRTAAYDAVAIGLGAWLVPGCLTWLLWRPADRYDGP